VNDPRIKKWLGQVVGKEGEDLTRHDKWLCMMYPRLKLLHRLLAKDGVIFCQLNDDEIHYAKVILDEIFGRDGYINQVSVKMKQTSGASGGGEDKRLKKNIENILIYAKDRTGENGFKRFNDVYDEEDLMEIIDDMESSGKSWKYTSVLLSKGKFIEERTVLDGSGDPILVKKYEGVKRTTISSIIKNGSSIENAYCDNFEKIFSDTNAQTSIRTRIIDEFQSLSDNEILEAEYIPRTGRDRGNIVQHYYISQSIRRVIWLKDTAVKRGKKLLKLEKAGTYWDGFPLNNLTKEGGVQFPNGKKPSLLIEKILNLATNPSSIVLDSFAGSGTTAHAVLKLNAQDGGNRRFILCEMMDYAETITAERVRRVMAGYGEGNKTTAGLGGAFSYYTVGEPLFLPDGNLNEAVGVQVIRDYVAYTENIPQESRTTMDNPVSPYLLGQTPEAAWLFHYEPNRVTLLDMAFLENLQFGGKRPPMTLVYADACLLQAEFMQRYGLIFKKIPRDITRL
jgi:adenine-specific DNA-methyltransferase